MSTSQSQCGDALQLGSKEGMIHSTCGCKCGWQVKLCDPLLTHAIPECLREEELIIKRYANKFYSNTERKKSV